MLASNAARLGCSLPARASRGEPRQGCLDAHPCRAPHRPRSKRTRGAVRTLAAIQSPSAAGASGSGLADFEDFVLQWQTKLCDTFEKADGSGQRFCTDRWDRGSASAGYGITRVMEGGHLLEKAACNVSVVRGSLDAQRAAAMSGRGRPGVDPKGGQPYSAVALSLVFHSARPHLPTFRADVRCFQARGYGYVEGVGAWFGGGADLTPFYLFEQDAREFHAHWRRVCDPHGAALYPAYKKWCDDYFNIPCRGERRGVGGIFFDDLPASGYSAEYPSGQGQGQGNITNQGPQGVGGGAMPAPADAAAFTRAVCEGLPGSYLPICERRRSLPFSEEQRTWQLRRRGRYLEFNLLYDRGVKFGLTGGRFESVMVSAPPLIRWDYNVVPEEGSEEAKLVEVLRAPRDWA